MSELRFLRAFEKDEVNIIPADKETAERILELPRHEIFTLQIKDGTRTSKQQAAIEVYCRELAKQLNDSGSPLVIEYPWGKRIEIPWSQEEVKSRIWRPIQRALLQKKSTTKLTTTEVNEIYEVVAMNMAESCGIDLEFPSRGF